MYCEIVVAIDGETLRDPRAFKRPYRTMDGRPLARGIYAACWPEGIAAPSYESDAMYVGPFPTWVKAGHFVRVASKPDSRTGHAIRAGAKPQTGASKAP